MLYFRKYLELADWEKADFYRNITTGAAIGYKDKITKFQFKAISNGTINYFRYYRIDSLGNDCEYTEIDIISSIFYNTNTGIVKSNTGYSLPSQFSTGIYEIRININDEIYKSEPFLINSNLELYIDNIIRDENFDALKTENYENILI